MLNFEQVEEALKDPKTLFTTPKGKKTIEDILDYFNRAASTAIRLTHIPEVRNNIDKELLVDILHQGTTLAKHVAKMDLSFQIATLGPKETRSTGEWLFANLYLEAYNQDIRVRDICRRTLNLYVPNWEKRKDIFHA